MGDNNSKKELMEEIQSITDYLYQNRLSEGTKALPSLIQQLASFAHNLEQEDVPIYTNILKNIMEAMEIKDYILLSDLLIYEITPLIDQYDW